MNIREFRKCTRREDSVKAGIKIKAFDIYHKIKFIFLVKPVQTETPCLLQNILSKTADLPYTRVVQNTSETFRITCITRDKHTPLIVWWVRLLSVGIVPSWPLVSRHRHQRS